MVRLLQLVLSLLPLSVWERPEVLPESLIYSTSQRNATKSIAIVGAGSAGLAALKAILDLPPETRAGWEVVLYERRRAVGGVWLGDPPGYEPHPPEVPETPLYPLLKTNTPHPTMTYPHFPFAEGTTLFPRWDAVERYHADFAVRHDLTPYIRFNHTVVAADWRGDDVAGEWQVEVHAHHGDPDGELVMRRTFDHLLVANGHNHYPHVPVWEGTEEWLASSPAAALPREILHSIYYRQPERYTNYTVLVVGAGASAYDIAMHVGPLARTVYQSVKANSTTAPSAIPKSTISHFTRDSVVFDDGTSLTDVDRIVLATGYELRVPFLSAPHSSVLLTDNHATTNSSTAQTLTTNLRYLYPLYRQIYPIVATVPPTALAFVGLPLIVANCPSDYAQGVFIAHTLADPSLLPSHAHMRRELLAREASLHRRGYDPYAMGHKLLDGRTETEDYQEGLFEFLKKRGALPDDGKRYVEKWRRLSWQEAVWLYRGWRRVQAAGQEEERRWLKGVATEDQWADMLYRLIEWQRRWEEEHGDGMPPLDILIE